MIMIGHTLYGTGMSVIEIERHFWIYYFFLLNLSLNNFIIKIQSEQES